MDAKTEEVVEDVAKVVDVLDDLIAGDGAGLLDGEPVAVSHAVTALLTVAVAVGWLTVPLPIINIVGSVVAGAVSFWMARRARAKVVPVATLAAAKARAAK